MTHHSRPRQAVTNVLQKHKLILVVVRKKPELFTAAKDCNENLMHKNIFRLVNDSLRKLVA